MWPTGYGPLGCWWQPGWGNPPSPYKLFGSSTPPVSPGLVWQNSSGVYSNTITPSGLTSIGVTTVNASTVNTSALSATGGVSFSALANGVVLAGGGTGTLTSVPVSGYGNGVLQSYPTLINPTINFISSDSSTPLSLAGGNTGANISLGNGANALVTITTSGSGSTIVNGPFVPHAIHATDVITTSSTVDYNSSGPVASILTTGGIYAAKQIVSGTSMTVGTNLAVTGNVTLGTASTIGNASGSLNFASNIASLSGSLYVDLTVGTTPFLHVINAAVMVENGAFLSVSSTLDAYSTSIGSITTLGGIYATKQIVCGSTISTGQGPMASIGQWNFGQVRTSTGLAASTTTGLQVAVGGVLYTLAVLSTNP